MTLEELLNLLIGKGWKPRGHKAKSIEVFSNYMNINFDDVSEECTVAEIVRKSSGLWQFVCENGMVKANYYSAWEGYKSLKTKAFYTNIKYQYYLIESALCDEDKLEDFILQNVKID